MIKIINRLYLTPEGCSIKQRNKFFPVHIRQGDIDGACSVYALMMNLLILNTIKRTQLEDLYDKIKKSPEVENLFKEFFGKHGLIRNGFYFHDVCKLVNKTFGKVIEAKVYENEKENYPFNIIDITKEAINSDYPIMLGIDFKGGGGHAVLAIGYESDDGGLFNIFCLDPGYDYNPTSYWNMVISLDINKGQYPHQCLTENRYNCPYIKLMDALRITKI